MSHLPPALRPWAPQLVIFPEELALSLGPHVARLASAIGGLADKGVIVQGSSPIRLTKQSRVEFQEMAFYYDGEGPNG